MDPVDPAVHVVGVLQRPLVERGRVVLPLRREPGDGGGGQARGRAEELLQRRHEVAGRKAVQVQQRQHLRDARGLPCPRRQDRRGEPRALTRSLVDALVVDPRLTHRHRTRRRGDLPRLVETVADHQPVPPLVNLTSVRLDIPGDLGQQRSRQHLPSTVTGQLVEQRPTHRHRGMNVGLGPLLDYLEHGRAFPNRRANAGPDHRALDSRSSSGRRVASRHQAEGHPQVLIIARMTDCGERSIHTSGPTRSWVTSHPLRRSGVAHRAARVSCGCRPAPVTCPSRPGGCCTGSARWAQRCR